MQIAFTMQHDDVLCISFAPLVPPVVRKPQFAQTTGCAVAAAYGTVEPSPPPPFLRCCCNSQLMCCPWMLLAWGLLGTCFGKLNLNIHCNFTVTVHRDTQQGTGSPQFFGGNSKVIHPHSQGHAEGWVSITPTPEAKPKRGSPSPKSRGHGKAWESITATWGPQPEGPHRSMGVHHPNGKGHAEGRVSITPT